MQTGGIRLTTLSTCAGCAAKLGAAELRDVMARVQPATSPQVAVGYEGGDDAGVYLLGTGTALVQSVDFFTPIVDDPYDFGRIAAANALSDIYAMGGRPLTALNIVAIPEDLDREVLVRILDGGAAIARAAGVAVIGGHTIRDDEPKYGMAVTGTIDPERIVRSAGARPGDALVLTKPLGTGALTTAHKRGLLRDEDLIDAIAWMTTLNDTAAAAMLAAGAHAATDVTGFGLLGHAGAMARASGVCFEIEAKAVPLMDGALGAIARGAVASGSQRNAQTHAHETTFAASVAPALRLLLSDAQTSGGLLIALPRERLEGLRCDLRAAGLSDAVVGDVRAGSGIRVR